MTITENDLLAELAAEEQAQFKHDNEFSVEDLALTVYGSDSTKSQRQAVRAWVDDLVREGRLSVRDALDNGHKARVYKTKQAGALTRPVCVIDQLPTPR